MGPDLPRRDRQPGSLRAPARRHGRRRLLALQGLRRRPADAGRRRHRLHLRPGAGEGGEGRLWRELRQHVERRRALRGGRRAREGVRSGGAGPHPQHQHEKDHLVALPPRRRHGGSRRRPGHSGRARHRCAGQARVPRAGRRNHREAASHGQRRRHARRPGLRQVRRFDGRRRERVRLRARGRSRRQGHGASGRDRRRSRPARQARRDPHCRFGRDGHRRQRGGSREERHGALRGLRLAAPGCEDAERRDARGDGGGSHRPHAVERTGAPRTAAHRIALHRGGRAAPRQRGVRRDEAGRRPRVGDPHRHAVGRADRRGHGAEGGRRVVRRARGFLPHPAAHVRGPRARARRERTPILSRPPGPGIEASVPPRHRGAQATGDRMPRAANGP